MSSILPTKSLEGGPGAYRRVLRLNLIVIMRRALAVAAAKSSRRKGKSPAAVDRKRGIIAISILSVGMGDAIY